MKSYSERQQRRLRNILEQRIRKLKLRKGLDPVLQGRKARSRFIRPRKTLTDEIEGGIREKRVNTTQEFDSFDDASPHQSDSSCENSGLYELFSSRDAMIVETAPAEVGSQLASGDPCESLLEDTGTGHGLASDKTAAGSSERTRGDALDGSGIIVSSTPSQVIDRLKSPSQFFHKNTSKRRVSLIELPDVSIVEVGTTSESESLRDDEEGSRKYDMENDDMSMLDSSNLPGRNDELENSDLHPGLSRDTLGDVSLNYEQDYGKDTASPMPVDVVSVQKEQTASTKQRLPHHASDAESRSSRSRHSSVNKASRHDSRQHVEQFVRGNSEPHRRAVPAEDVIRVFKHRDTDHCFVIFRKDISVPFVGKANMQVLSGEVKINGFRIEASSQSYPVYSTHFTALSQLEVSCPGDLHAQKNNVKASITALLEAQDVEEFEGFVKNSRFSAILLQRLNCHAWDYTTQFGSYKRISTNINYDLELFRNYQPLFRSLGLSLCVNDNTRTYESRSLRTLPGQDRAVASILDHLADTGKSVPVIVVCGKKGTGKSTMSRHIVNQLLNRVDGICYIEADVGQSEMTPSCLLSLHHVTEPLLGLPFVHQRKPERMYFFGCNETKSSPNLYIEMLTKLHQYYRENHSSRPLVVNTNGHMQGLGGSLIQDIINITQPTHTILLEDPLDKHPFEFDKVKGWVSGDAPTKISTRVLRLEPAPDPESGHVFVRIGPSGHRTLTLMSYFSSLVRAPNWSLVAVTPYVVPWSAVAVHICNTAVFPNNILYALNGSVVGLCDVKPNMMHNFDNTAASDMLPKSLGSTPLSTFECLGLGLIRGIDPVAKVFYIITPVPAEELRRVTALIKGTNFIRLPVMMKGLKNEEAPYVCHSYTDNPGCYVPRKRTKFLVRRRPPHGGPR